MGRIAQLVMGPAGTGKSTYCNAMRQHSETLKRVVHCINLDPAAEEFTYPVAVDIRDLVTLEDVMEADNYGPNGGLVYCMEYRTFLNCFPPTSLLDFITHLVQNLDWLRDELGDYQDDYLIIDCPGQIELYTHFPHMRLIAEALQQWDYAVCAVWLIDSHFIDESSKFLSASLTSLSAMLQLGVPHVNVLTKMDLLGKKEKSSKLEKYFELDTISLLSDLSKETGPRFSKLNEAMATLLDEFNLVSFLPLNITDPDSLTMVLSHIDSATQYGEDLEPRDPYEGIDENEDEIPHDDDTGDS